MTKIVDPAVWLEMPINPVFDFNFDKDKKENTESFFEIYTMQNDILNIKGWIKIDWEFFFVFN